MKGMIRLLELLLFPVFYRLHQGALQIHGVIIPATSGPTMTSNLPGVNFLAFLSILTIVPASSFTLSKNLPSLKTSQPPDLPVCTNLCTTLPESMPVSTAKRLTLGPCSLSCCHLYLHRTSLQAKG